MFARKLAARGRNLVLVARSEDKLAALCAELAAAHKIDAQYVASDLTEREAPARLFAETERRGLEVESLVNNAGFGAVGDFHQLDLENELLMVDLNVRALVELTHRYLGPMRARGRGEIFTSPRPPRFSRAFMATLRRNEGVRPLVLDGAVGGEPRGGDKSSGPLPRLDRPQLLPRRGHADAAPEPRADSRGSRRYRPRRAR